MRFNLVEFSYRNLTDAFAGIHRDQVPLLSESSGDEDIDVANERRRVANQQQGANTDILVLDRLTKVT